MHGRHLRAPAVEFSGSGVAHNRGAGPWKREWLAGAVDALMARALRARRCRHRRETGVRAERRVAHFPKCHTCWQMDKVYKASIPRHKETLADLKREFARIRPATDWVRLRVQPLLKHATTLERLLRSPKFSSESTRLRKGVVMFHADLVYLRANIKALNELLAAEKRRARG